MVRVRVCVVLVMCVDGGRCEIMPNRVLYTQLRATRWSAEMTEQVYVKCPRLRWSSQRLREADEHINRERQRKEREGREKRKRERGGEREREREERCCGSAQMYACGSPFLLPGGGGEVTT